MKKYSIFGSVFVVALLAVGLFFLAKNTEPSLSSIASREPGAGCVWNKIQSGSGELSFLSQKCLWEGLIAEVKETGLNTFVIGYNDGAMSDPIIELLVKPSEVEEVLFLKNHYISQLPDYQREHCVVIPVTQGTPENILRFIIGPDEEYSAKIQLEVEEEQISEDPCGTFGFVSGGLMQYFEFHPLESNEKYLFLKIGEDFPIFDEQSFRIQ